MSASNQQFNNSYIFYQSPYHELFHCTYFSANKCESNWILFGDSCYFFAPNAKDKDTAENDCVGKDSHLASIHSNEESEFVTISSGILDRKLVPGENVQFSGFAVQGVGG